MRYVIIGNSTACVGAIEGIRAVDQAGEIIVISKENHSVYSRPLISYLLHGKVGRDQMGYRKESFYQDMHVQLIMPASAQRIDLEKRLVTLDDGREIPYDKLLVATGSSPFVPPIKGLGEYHLFGGMDDALALDRALTPKSRVLILGAGLIGLKCAEGIVGRAASVTVVDLADRVLSSILDDHAAALVQQHLEQNGVGFKLGQGISSVESNVAQLSGGEQIPYDILVLAVGVRPNVQLIEQAGGRVERGVWVDRGMKTSLDDVYAAGDCALSKDAVSGERKMLALLPNAYMQGECAGRNMAGDAMDCAPMIAMNAIGFFGLHIMTAGQYQGGCTEMMGEGSYKKLFYQDDALQGFVLVDRERENGQSVYEKAGIYTNLIRERTPLHTLDFALIAERPGLMAFSKERRSELLGGA